MEGIAGATTFELSFVDTSSEMVVLCLVTGGVKVGRIAGTTTFKLSSVDPSPEMAIFEGAVEAA